MKASTVSALFLFILMRGTAKQVPLASDLDLTQPVSAAQPVLVNTCLITSDVKRLTDFYAQVLRIEPQRSGDDYVEFRTTAGTLALFSAAAQEKYIPGSSRAGENHSAILEFRVADVNSDYARLGKFVKSWIKGPTTQPWGTRSIYFRDPDGNLVDFFMPVAAR